MQGVNSNLILMKEVTSSDVVMPPTPMCDSQNCSQDALQNNIVEVSDS